MSEKGRLSHINIVQVKPYIFTTVLHDSIALTLPSVAYLGSHVIPCFLLSLICLLRRK